MINILQLRNHKEIRLAEKILYDVYIVEQAWDLHANNQSGLKIVEQNGHHYLTDDYREHAVWVGVFDQQALVGCGRIVQRDKNKLLEIERYQINSTLQQKIKFSNYPNLVELNRSAIQKNYRGQSNWLQLLSYAFQYCYDHQLSAIATTSISKVKKLHHAIKFNRLENEDFYYSSLDKYPAEVYLADFDSGDILTIRNCSNDFSQKL